MINAEGKRHWVKFHFKTNQGIEFFTQDEAERKDGENADFHREDLWVNIREGNYPSRDLYLQVAPVHDAGNYRFNPLDLTKTWSQQDYPLRKARTRTLNRTPQSSRAQTEPAASAPTNSVP